MSLRARINLVITLVIVLFTIATAQTIVHDMRSSIREEIESATRIAVQLIETVVAGVYREPGPAERNEALLEFLRRVGRVRGNEIRFYDANGVLRYQSPPSSYRAGSWAPQWFARLMEPGIKASRLDLPGGAIVVTPDPSRSILEAWEDLKGFAWLALGLLVLTNVAVFWFLDRSLKPLPQILDGLSEMARGRFQVRLPEFRLAEFASISHGFNRMAQALEESLAQNRQLALVAQQSSDAIVIRDLAGRITFCNAAAERLLGYAERELVGSSALLIAPADRHDELCDSLESVKRRERVELPETQRLTKTGRLVDVALSAAPLVDPASDRVIAEICSMRDITEHKRMQAAERELEQSRSFTALVQSRLEEERRAIARELHDELAQCVTAIKTIGTAIANRAGESAPEIRDNANSIVSVASHIYDVVHGIIRRLRPSGLDHLGLGETLRDAASAWSQRHPDVRWDLALSGELEGLGEAVSITVYRIVQEALTNVIRHAEATRVQISVSRERAASSEDAVIVCVQDNGKGLGQASAREDGRFGLAGMRERVQAFGGSFAISDAPGHGVTVRAVLPVAGAERAAQLETRA
ncbi:MAG TPA: PAS domain S-box protein [Burkholderiales bacterium]|nr:PAS domain S-box protein [Burkholderiales bacterium]